jgi:hypothetical protein
MKLLNVGMIIVMVMFFTKSYGQIEQKSHNVTKEYKEVVHMKNYGVLPYCKIRVSCSVNKYVIEDHQSLGKLNKESKDRFKGNSDSILIESTIKLKKKENKKLLGQL